MPPIISAVRVSIDSRYKSYIQSAPIWKPNGHPSVFSGAKKLQIIINNKLCSPQVHRLVVVDEQEVVMGIVSLSDILQALVLTNGDEGENTTLPSNDH